MKWHNRPSFFVILFVSIIFGNYIIMVPRAFSEQIFIETPEITSGLVATGLFYDEIAISSRFTNDFDGSKQVHYSLNADDSELVNWVEIPNPASSIGIRIGAGNLDAHSAPATFSDGSFIVVSAQNEDIYFQKFNSNGASINQATLLLGDRGFYPRVTVLADDSFIVVWRDIPKSICVFGMRPIGSGCAFGYEINIFAQRFDSNGNPLGNSFKVNSDNYNTVESFELVSFADKSFAVVWENGYTLSSDYRLFAQFFSNTGQTVGNGKENPFSLYDNVNHSNWDYTVINNGDLIVVWQDNRADNSNNIRYQRFGSDGSVKEDNVLVNTNNVNTRTRPDIAGLKEGGYVVAWHRKGDDGRLNIQARRYPQIGNPETEFQVNGDSNDQFNQKNPQVAGLKGNKGGFVVVWQGVPNDNSSENIYATLFDSDGYAVSGNENFQLNKTSVGNQIMPKVVALPNFPEKADKFLLFWDDTNLKSYMLKRIVCEDQNLDIEPHEEQVFQYDNSSKLKTTITVFPDDAFFTTLSGLESSQAKFFSGQKTIEISGLTPTESIQIQLKVVEPSTNQEWFSNINRYSYADPNDGEGYSIIFDDGYTNNTSLTISTDLPQGNYTALQLYQSTTSLENDTCRTFGEWQTVGNSNADKREVIVTLDDATCYQFKWKLTNLVGNQFEYTSNQVVYVDQSPPELRFSENINDDQYTLSIETIFEATSIIDSRYVLNNGTETGFTSNQLSLVLVNGANHVQLYFTDRAGNIAEKHLFPAVDLNPPDVIISGISEGDTVGDEIVLTYQFTQDLHDLLFYIDEEPIQDLEIYVNGELKDNLDGLDEGTNHVVIKGKDSSGNDVTMSFKIINGEIYIDTNLLTEGQHSFSIQGKDKNNQLVKKTIGFNVDHGVFTLSLLSPQNREYNNNVVNVRFYTNKTLNKVWYSLNNGPTSEELTLQNLADGEYQITVFAESSDNKTASSTVDFTVKQAVAQLNVLSPQPGQLYGSNEVEVVFNSNSPVTYVLGDTSGVISSGHRFTLPDGEHQLTLTAIHPVSNSATHQEITFSTDTKVPQLVWLSPQPGIYTSKEIPILYQINKELKNVRMQLDGVDVSLLENMASGVHNFNFYGEDQVGRQVQHSVQFNVSHLEIISPKNNEKIVSNVFPPKIPFQYEAEGDFSALSFAVDEESPQLITSAPGEIIEVQTRTGYHDLALKGDYYNHELSRQNRFQTGTKNLSARADSINYDYNNCFEGVCDISVTLTVRNTGDLKIEELVNVQFTHVSRNGGYQTQLREFESLDIGKLIRFDLDVFKGSLGDTLMIAIDPNNDLQGEDPRDNSYSIPISIGEITNISSKLPSTNTYVENLSYLVPQTITTAGPVVDVTVLVNDISFTLKRRKNSSNTFTAHIDTGLLTENNNCVRIFAYSSGGKISDSRILCFQMINIHANQPEIYFTFPWEQYFSGDRTVNMKELNLSQVYEHQIAHWKSGIERGLSFVPATRDDLSVVYQISLDTKKVPPLSISTCSGLLGESPSFATSLFESIFEPNKKLCNNHSIVKKFFYNFNR